MTFSVEMMKHNSWFKFFNHKNIWVNLQNPNPLMIFYNIHDREKWLPYVEIPESISPDIANHPKAI